MKNNDIQQLLERYREGTLSDSELAELNRLAGRDAVMADAGQRAAGIIRRRRTTLFTLSGLLVAGATMWTLLAPRHSEGPLVAEAVVPQPEVVVTEPAAVEQLAPARPEVRPTVKRQVVKKEVPIIHEPVDSEPVVVCNNQCEADSVISDIWKFLTV